MNRVYYPLLVLLVLSLSTDIMYSQTWPTPDQCGSATWGCNSNDFRIIDVFVGNLDTTKLAQCEFGNPTTANLWINVFNNASSTRFVAWILADVYLDDVFSKHVDTCIVVELGGKDTIPINAGTIDWTCGQEIKLEDIVFGAPPNNMGWPMACGFDPCTELSGTKCGGFDSVLVLAPVVANFTFACTTPENTIQFTDASSGGDGSYSYVWSFGDGNMSNQPSPSHTYPARSIYNVQLIVTDTIDGIIVHDTSVQMVDLNICCIFEVTCPPNLVPGTFSCTNTIPPPHSTVADFEAEFGDLIGNNPCDTVLLFSMDNPGIVNNCATNNVIRTYVIYNDANRDNSYTLGEDSVHCAQIFTYQPDITAPVFTFIPNDATVQCDGNYGVNDLGTALANDNCQGMVTISSSDITISGTCPDSFLIKRVWTATDLCMNFATDTQFIQIIDDVPPVFTNPPQDLTIDCATGAGDLMNWLTNNGMATATDNCGTVGWSNDFGTQPNACAGGNTITVNFTAEDDCSNSSSMSATLTVNDNSPPQITVMAQDSTVECDGNGNINDYNSWISNHGWAEATDDCGTITWSSRQVSSLPGCGMTRVDSVHFYAMDACGNIDSTAAKFIIEDNTQPTPPADPANMMVSCALDIPAAPILQASDICQGIVPGVLSEVVSDSTCPNRFTLTRTWSFTDGCLNSSSASQIITVNDNINPTISGVTDTTIFIDCDANPPVFNPAAMDNCGLVRLNTSSITSPGMCPITEITEITYTATDTCGNTSSVVVTIVVQDTTVPVLTIPADMVLSCDMDTSIAGTGMASATDACANTSVSSTTVIEPGNCPHNYTILRIWTAIDACQNSVSDTQRIVVEDTDPPILTNPTPIMVQCGPGQMSAIQAWLDIAGGATATDNCSDTVTWTNRLGLESGGCDAGGNGTIPVTFIAMDECGNIDSVVGQVMIVDNEPPEITSEANDMQVECDGMGNNTEYLNWLSMQGGAMASDDCGIISWRQELISSVSGCGTVRTDSVHFIAEDLCGNSDTSAAKFIIEDSMSPTLSIPPLAVVECTADTTPTGTGMATGTDICGNVTISRTDNIIPGSCPGNYTILRSWTATDDCLNATTQVQTIMVSDTEGPIINCPPDSFAICDASEVVVFADYGAFEAGGGSASDNCGLDLGSLVYIGETSQKINQGFRVERTYRISDLCGNTSTCIHVIWVIDPIPPVAIAKDSIFVTAGPNGVTNIQISDVDMGSYDNCEIDTIFFSPSQIQCGFYYNVDIVRNLRMTVVDKAGNIDIANTVAIVSCPCPPDGLEPSCADDMNISLGPGCSLELDAAMVLTGDVTECYNPYEIDIRDQSGTSYGNTLDVRHIGSTLIVTIRDTITGNSCWSRLHVEDKYPPVFACRKDTVSCFDPLPPLPIADPDCYQSPLVNVLGQEWIAFGCDENPDFLGISVRRLRAIDAWGTEYQCADSFWIRRETIRDVVCPADTVIACCSQDASGKYYLWNEKYVWFDDHGIPHPKPLIDDNGKNEGLAEPPILISGTDTVFLWPGNKLCQLYVDYKDHVTKLCDPTYLITRKWVIKDWCTGEELVCEQLIKIVDTLAPVVKPLNNLKVVVNPHDCKGKIELKRPEIENECLYQFHKDGVNEEINLTFEYEIEFHDPVHPGKLVFKSGLIPPEGVHLYLPVGDFQIRYKITDPCWNTREVVQDIWVIDEAPPVPVCDEITQVTLDPESCKVKIFASELDDGSHDNCCSQLHFAVAKMNDIEYWRNYWHHQLISCFGEYEYHHNLESYQLQVELWIECYVFQDYLELDECGEDTLVLRVYDVCGLPTYDPHIFKGSKHQWYCWNQYDEFACFFRLYYPEMIGYDPVFPDLCEDTFARNCIKLKMQSPGPIKNRICCEYKNADDINRWNMVLQKYPELADNYLGDSRIRIPVSYSECMIRVIKDDKAPPICEAPNDVTYYCDGVPYWVDLPFKLDGANNPYHIKAPGYTWNVCGAEGDYLSFSSCPKNGWYNNLVGGRCCVEVPWTGYDSETHGYYGGPLNDHYSHHYAKDPCNYKVWVNGTNTSSTNWRPIYCSIWLWLDRYDYPPGKPKFEFGEPTYIDNCTNEENLSVAYSDDGSINECGVGVLTRTWTISDQCELTSSCQQRITVLPRSDFEVVFPPDLEIDCISTMNDEIYPRDAFGELEISDDDCELIGVSYEDKIIEVVPGSCKKIERTWTLIDWCVFNADITKHFENLVPDVIVDDRIIAGEDRNCIYRHLKDNGDGYLTYTQIIKIIDRDAPEISCIQPFIICNSQSICTEVPVDTILGQGMDNCTPSDLMSYRYYWMESGNQDPQAISYGHGKRFNHHLQNGAYDIFLIGEDNCGNVDTCMTSITVLDCKLPTPYCYHGITTVIMPSSGTITIWANDLDAGSYDNCSASENLTFSFSEDGSSPYLEFTCLDIPDGIEQIISLNIWVIDEQGNKDFCNTTLLLQDGVGDVCEGDRSLPSNTGRGKVFTKNSFAITKQALYVHGNSPNPFSSQTSISFSLSTNSVVRIKVFSLNGTLLKNEIIEGTKGLNEYLFNSDQGIDGGIYLYTISAGKHIYQGKMIHLR